MSVVLALFGKKVASKDSFLCGWPVKVLIV